MVAGFVDLFIDAAPLFALGAVAGAAVQRCIKPEWAERIIGRGDLSVLTATLAGAVLPGCAMTTMPIATVLRAKGVQRGTLTAFIMIAPILSPHTVILNLAMLGWPMTVARVVIPFAASLVLGIMLNRSGAAADIRQGSDPAGCACGNAACAEPPPSFALALWRLVKTLGPLFLGGLLSVAVLQPFVSFDFLARHAHSPWAYAVALVAGVPLYVCEGGEVPLTLALLKLGVGLGPAFTFLLSSVGTCLPTLTMAPRIIGWRATWAYLAMWPLMAVGGGILLAGFLGL